MFLKKYKNLRTFRPYYKKYTKLILCLLFVMLIASSAGIIIGFLMSEQLLAITDMLIPQIVTYTLYILLCVTIHHTYWFLWVLIQSKLSNKIAFDIKHNIFNSLLHTKYELLIDKTSGYYLERLTDDVDAVSNFWGNVAGTLIDVFTNCSFLIVIYFLNWQCGLFFSISVVILFVIDNVRVKLEVKNIELIKKSNEQASSKFIETLNGIKEIKGLGITEKIEDNYSKINRDLHNKQHKKIVIDNLLTRIKTYLQYIIDACLVLMCAFWLFPTHQITVISLLVIFNYKGLMYDTVSFFSKMKSEYVQGDFCAGRILELLQMNKENFGTKHIKIVDSSVQIKNLSFSYNKTSNILKNLSCDIPENSCSVFIGESGSGKSTLFKILTKLLEIENSKVFLGGIDLNQFNEKSLRDTISIVNQEPFLFNDSIINNLKLANSNATKSEIINICKLANVHNDIISMSNGYDTKILENGNNLSGGQKQRIAIARALLKNTPILLFDEPTSALDKNNQDKFFKVLQTLKSHKTILVIAHRLNDYSLFDNVFELNKNK